MEINRLKELICSYEAVIEEFQRDKGSPYQARSHYGTSEGFYSPHQKSSDNKMQLETNIYVSNLLRKIALLE